jgi:protein SCO1/2
MSARSRMLAGFLLANFAIAVVAAWIILNRPDTPPLIQGVLLPEGRPVANFTLLDHHNQSFSNEDLLGRWHLVSYGFTTCPDICPTILAQLALVTKELQAQGDSDLRILFYSVDHRRDTVRQLQSYIPFFHPDFIGLTHLDDPENPHLAFEKSLGIIAQLMPIMEVQAGETPDANAYDVSHGVTLFLINPEGELQAIFEPDKGLPGTHSFNPDTILGDYLAIRSFLG